MGGEGPFRAPSGGGGPFRAPSGGGVLLEILQVGGGGAPSQLVQPVFLLEQRGWGFLMGNC